MRKKWKIGGDEQFLNTLQTLYPNAKRIPTPHYQNILKGNYNFQLVEFYNEQTPQYNLTGIGKPISPIMSGDEEEISKALHKKFLYMKANFDYVKSTKDWKIFFPTDTNADLSDLSELS
jgi:hypothetical protein